MRAHQGKHRRESEWAALQCRIRDTCDKIADARDRYVGKHRDDAPQALA